MARRDCMPCAQRAAARAAGKLGATAVAPPPTVEYVVIDGDERTTFAHLDDAFRWQKQHGGKVRSQAITR